MLLVELGRAVTFTDQQKQNKVLVITQIQDAHKVIVQEPTTKEKQRVSLNKIKLLDIVVPITNEMTSSEVEDMIQSSGLISVYHKTEEFAQWKKAFEYRNMNDFERFKADLKSQIEKEVLTEMNLI